MSANPQILEHRWGTRVPLEVAAQLRTDNGAAIDVVVNNAGRSGAHVLTRARLPVLACVVVHVLERPAAWLEACAARQRRTLPH